MPYNKEGIYFKSPYGSGPRQPAEILPEVDMFGQFNQKALFINQLVKTNVTLPNEVKMSMGTSMAYSRRAYLNQLTEDELAGLYGYAFRKLSE